MRFDSLLAWQWTGRENLLTYI